MTNQEWAFVALEDGAIKAGRISEAYLFGRKVVKLELPTINSNFKYEYYSYDEIKGIRISSEEEIESIYSNVLCEDVKLKTEIQKYPALV